MNMMELIITSSVLIVVVLALRLLLRRWVSQRLIYALWLLVLLRLLVPVTFVNSSVSVMNPVSEAASAAAAVVEQAAARADAAAALESGQTGPDGQQADNPAGQALDPNTGEKPAPGQTATPGSAPKAKLPWWLTALRFVQADNYRALKLVWLAGAAGVGAWFLAVNILFRRKLRQTAVPVKAVDCALPLYWCEDIPSPCLVGLFRPSVYVTRFSADEQDKLTDVITHELCHWRQGDHIWVLLRCACVAAYWFNPLVWVAARVSREDCELACDELAIKKLGDARRIEYGRTLIRMIGARGEYSDRGIAATSMTADKKGIKERITRIACRQKRSILSIVALVLCASLVCACTFSGAPGGVNGSAEDASLANPDGTTRFMAYDPAAQDGAGGWTLFESVSTDAGAVPAFQYDYTLNAFYEVANDLAALKNIPVGEARQELLTGGYTVLLCVDPVVQTALEDIAYNPIYWDAEAHGLQGDTVNNIIWPPLEFEAGSVEAGNPLPARNQVQAAMVVMNYQGEVVGLTNGLREKDGTRRSLIPRQPGGAITPLADYAPALELDKITFSTIFADAPSETIGDNPWPRNYDMTYGPAVTVYDGLTRSLNTTAIFAMKLIGPDYAFDFLTKNLGFTTLADNEPMGDDLFITDRTLAMGLGGLSYGVTPVELCAAYQVFGNDGTYTAPRTYSHVYDKDGVLVLNKSESATPVKAISPDTAMIMNRMLQGVAKHGNGTAMASNLALPIAAQIGVTSESYDFWAVGLNPYYVMAVWEGYDEPAQMQVYRPQPTQLAFNLVMNRISIDLEPKPFPVSDDVVTASYCTETGLLAGGACPSLEIGFYKKDNMPDYCTHEDVQALQDQLTALHNDLYNGEGAVAG